jgi:gephyrin
MLTVGDAVQTVLAHVAPLPPHSVAVQDALGLVLARDVQAADPLPPFSASVKDGYAVIAADGPGDFHLVGRVTAGRMADFIVEPGVVAGITTGAPLPPGADAVVMVEETELLSGTSARVRIRSRVQPGQDVRPIGFDVAQGEVVLKAGERLGPAEVGLAATVGATQLLVHPRPRVGILSTGDELVQPGSPLGPGKIRDSNRPTLAAATIMAGGAPVDLGIVGDNPEELRRAFWAGLAKVDILVTSGGVSVGELDLVKALLEESGHVHFGRLLMKPGKPCTFATLTAEGATRLVFGLPGNPVSSLVTFLLVTLPAIRRMAGWREPKLARVQAQLAEPLRLDPWRPEYHRAALRWRTDLNGGAGGFLAMSSGSQVSSRLLSARGANALLELPKAEGVLPAGSVVPALLFDASELSAEGW